MNSDTLYRLAEIFGEMQRILQQAACQQIEKEDTAARLKTIKDAADLADRLMIIDGLDAAAAATTAAAHHRIAVKTVAANITLRSKVSIAARMKAADKKRRRGSSLRSIATDYKVPKSTLANRLAKPAPRDHDHDNHRDADPKP